MAFAYSPKIVTNGLILYLDAANPYSYVSGSTTWNDISRSGTNGTLISGSTYSTSSGGLIVLDGIDDFVGVSGSTLTTWTVSTTLYYTYNSKQYEFFLGNNLSDSTGKILLSYNGSVSFRRNTYNNFSATSTLISGKYTNLSFVSNGTTVSLYINGVYNSAVTPTSTSLPVESIGRAWSDSVWNSQVSIGELKIYNTTLNSTEILQNYNTIKGRFGL